MSIRLKGSRASRSISLALGSIVLGSSVLVVSPTAALSPANPGERVAPAMRPPIISAVNSAWRITVSIPRQTALKQAIEDFFANGALGAPIRVPQMLSRKLLLGKQVGTECIGRTPRGASTWEFVGDWGSSFESPTNRTGAWSDVWRNKQIRIYATGGPEAGGMFAGDVPCLRESITWRSGYQGIVVTSTTESAPAFASRALPEQSGETGFVPGQVYRAAMPAPAALEINGLQRFRAVFAPLTQTRNALIDQGYANPRILSRSIRVGRLEGGLCGIPSTEAGAPLGYFEFVGDWGARFQANTAWTASTGGLIQILEGRSGVFSVGQTPCIYQVITWTSAALGGEVTFESKPGSTPNPLPPLSIDVPSPTIPGGEDIVLPDFDAPDQDGVEIDAVSLGIDVTLADVVSGVTADYIRRQLGNLSTLLNAPGGQGQGAADAPQEAAGVIADTRATLDSAQGAVTSGAGDGSLTAEDAVRLQGELSALESQLDSIAASATVRIAGGAVRVPDLARTVGFDSTQSPVAGVKGSGVARGVTLDVKGPASIKRGRDGIVRVQVRPPRLKGTVRLVIVRKSSTGIVVVGAKRVRVTQGKATTRVRVSRAAKSGPYSLVTAFTPTSGSRTGVTVVSPIRVS